MDLDKDRFSIQGVEKFDKITGQINVFDIKRRYIENANDCIAVGDI